MHRSQPVHYGFTGTLLGRASASRLRAAGARKRRRHGFLHHFRLGKLLGQIARTTAHFTPHGRLISLGAKLL